MGSQNHHTLISLRFLSFSVGFPGWAIEHFHLAICFVVGFFYGQLTLFGETIGYSPRSVAFEPFVCLEHAHTDVNVHS